jgi:hypothetical protein
MEVIESRNTSVTSALVWPAQMESCFCPCFLRPTLAHRPPSRWSLPAAKGPASPHSPQAHARDASAHTDLSHCPTTEDVVLHVVLRHQQQVSRTLAQGLLGEATTGKSGFGSNAHGAWSTWQQLKLRLESWEAPVKTRMNLQFPRRNIHLLFFFLTFHYKSRFPIDKRRGRPSGVNTCLDSKCSLFVCLYLK